MRACIFDMDGTLVDNWRFHNHAWTSLLSEFGLNLTLEEFYTATGGGMTNSEILRKFVDDALPDTEIGRLAARKEAHYRDLYHPHLTELSGLSDFLGDLRTRGVKTALGTSAGRDNVEFILGGLGLSGSFDALVSAEDVTRGKPDPQVFQVAAERLDIEPADCLVFEDSPSGIEAARRAGMAVVAITTSLSPEIALGLGGHVRHTMPHYGNHASVDWAALALASENG